VCPALSAYWQFFSFDLDIEFDVFVDAFVFPRVFAVFQTCGSPFVNWRLIGKFAFKTHFGSDALRRRGVS